LAIVSSVIMVLGRASLKAVPQAVNGKRALAPERHLREHLLRLP
jgi:hypothetical protein